MRRGDSDWVVNRFPGIIGTARLTFGLIAPSQAMGSSDAYENMQVGVAFTVYEPSFTAGLKLRHVGGNDLCPKGTEENLTARMQLSRRDIPRPVTLWCCDHVRPRKAFHQPSVTSNAVTTAMIHAIIVGMRSMNVPNSSAVMAAMKSELSS